MTGLSELTTEELADGICSRAGRIAAAEAELLLWIGEFDRREGWAGAGLLSCAHWLSWRVGLSLSTAREQVRVARRLPDLPPLAEAFAAGRVSYSKVRAITRVAEPDDGIDWVELARHSSAAQLEQVVRGVRRAQANEAAEADPATAEWALRTRVRYNDNGSFSYTISGPAELLPVIEAGIEAKKAELQRQRDAEAAAAAGGTSEPERTDVSAEALEPAPEPGDVSAEAPDPAQDEAGGEPDQPALDLDEPAPPGWPAGATMAQVRQATQSFFLQDALARKQAQLDPQLEHNARAPQAADTSRASEQPAAATGDAVGEPPADASAETPIPPKVTDAQALLALAQDALAAEQTARPSSARRRRPQLTAQVDPISGWARQADGELLPPTSLRRVMKTLPGRGGVLRLRPLTAADLRRHDLGRSSREVSPALRELVGAMDGERCRFPGCTRRKKLHAHHVLYWSDGGPTDLGNLVLVCARHHTLIHQHGFRLTLHPDRTLDVSTADGVRLLHHPVQPWEEPAALAAGTGRHVSAETLPPDHVDARIDLGYVVSVLMQQAA